MADDQTILQHIDELVAEEHALRQQREAGAVGAEEELARLAQLEVELDRAWDLLRQRRARIEAGQDPAQAAERSAAVVEHYQQ